MIAGDTPKTTLYPGDIIVPGPDPTAEFEPYVRNSYIVISNDPVRRVITWYISSPRWGDSIYTGNYSPNDVISCNDWALVRHLDCKHVGAGQK